MFDSNDKNQYKKIAVSAHLKQRILDAHQARELAAAEVERPRGRSLPKPRQAWKPVLASFALVLLIVSASVLYSGRELVELSVGGQEVSGTAYGRALMPARQFSLDPGAMSIILPFTAETNEEVLIQVSEGTLSYYPDEGRAKEQRIKGKAELVWSLEASPDKVYELLVTGKKKESIFRLVFDDQEKIWLLKEE